MEKASRLQSLVAEILFREWDPIGVNNCESCRDEYDRYVPTIVSWLLNGIDQFKLASHLSEIQRVSMGMLAIDEDRHLRVAQRLIGILADSR